MRHYKLLISSCLLTLVCAGGCEADEDDGGTAPSIESLSLSGDGATVGAASTISGMLTFTDPDGDLQEAEIEVTDPAGTAASVSTPITGIDGMLEGTVVLQVQIIPSEAGTYEATVILHDAEGNASEPDTTTFEVS